MEGGTVGGGGNVYTPFVEVKKKGMGGSAANILNINICTSDSGSVPNIKVGGGGEAETYTSYQDAYDDADPAEVSFDQSTTFCGLAALPIQLINFETETNNNVVNISWQTAIEIDNDFFTIERSKDGENWEFKQQIEGAGNSSEIINYSNVDKHPYPGVSYYRLKQTDFDGQESFSEIRFVDLTKGKLIEVDIYPNPTSGLFTIEGLPDEISKVRIFNNLGMDVTKLAKNSIYSNSKRNLDISQLSAGVYTLFTKGAAIKVVKQ